MSGARRKARRRWLRWIWLPPLVFVGITVLQVLVLLHRVCWG
jgi:hypothetical protein